MVEFSGLRSAKVRLTLALGIAAAVMAAVLALPRLLPEPPPAVSPSTSPTKGGPTKRGPTKRGPADLGAEAPLPPADGELSGQVLSETGEPIFGAIVSAYPVRTAASLDPEWREEQTREARTDPEGKFRITGLVRGRVFVSARAPVHCDVGKGRLQTETEDPDHLPDDSKLRLYLLGCAAASGRVLSSGGDPVPGATVSLIVVQPAHGQPALPRGGHDNQATTDSEGRFSLLSLPPGHVRVKVSHPELGTTDAEFFLRSGEHLEGEIEIRL